MSPYPVNDETLPTVETIERVRRELGEYLARLNEKERERNQREQKQAA